MSNLHILYYSGLRTKRNNEHCTSHADVWMRNAGLHETCMVIINIIFPCTSNRMYLMYPNNIYILLKITGTVVKWLRANSAPRKLQRPVHAAREAHRR